MDKNPISLGIMASHGGTNLQAIMDGCAQGALNAEVKLVISNNSGSRALSRARAGNIPALHLSSITHPRFEDLDLETKNMFLLRGVNYVILAGYMKKIGPGMLRSFPNRILNSHPSLLPNYCGPGMYGKKVHEAVLSAGEKKTGVTIHLVDEEYDHGPIVDQVKLCINPDQSVEKLERTIKSVEHNLWVDTIRKLQQGLIDLDSMVVDSF